MDSKKHSATVGSIEAALRKLKSTGHPLHCVVIDYLQLIESTGRHDNRVQEISTITRALKRMAMEIGLVVLLLSQLSRESEKQSRRPTLSDLRDSGSIEQDGDIVEFLHWESKQEELTREVRRIENILAKQREGPLGTTDLFYETKYTTFHEWAHVENAA